MSAISPSRCSTGVELTAPSSRPTGSLSLIRPGQSADHTEAEVVRERATSLLERAGAEKRPLMFFFGVGDHGGGPTRAAIEELRELEATRSRFAGPLDAGAVFRRRPRRRLDAARDGRRRPSHACCRLLQRRGLDESVQRSGREGAGRSRADGGSGRVGHRPTI